MARNQRMDSIKTPDMKNLSKAQSDNINNFDRYSRPEDNSGKVRVTFDRATPMKELDSILAQKHEKKDEVEQLIEDFEPKRKKAAKSGLSSGVKITGTYVARRRVINISITLVALLVVFAFFIPPFYTANNDESSCRYEDIFKNDGATGYKTQLVKDHYVYNLNAMSSDKSDSYRICTVAFEARNFSPFAVHLDDYSIASGGKFEENIVYAAAASPDSLEIPAFTTKTVQVEIMVNRVGLSDEEFDKAVTSLTLYTRGMKKQISSSFELPCIPAFVGVSDVISFDPNSAN